MENDKFKRITTGKLPEAHIAFLDECYKCNAPVLNILLSIMNEKTFFNGDAKINIPLITLFGASNEMPEDESLAALHDRFIVRFDLQYIKDKKNIKKMHMNFLNTRAIKAPTTKTTLSIPEINELQKKAKMTIVPQQIINQYMRIMDVLEKSHSIKLSDRRRNECLKLMQANAVLRGANIVSFDDFKYLPYALWENKDQLVFIREEIDKNMDPFIEEFKTVTGLFDNIKQNIKDSKNKDAQARSVVQIESKEKLEQLVINVNKLADKMQNAGQNTADVNLLKTNIMDFTTNIVNDIMGGMMSMGSSDSDPFTDSSFDDDDSLDI